MEGTNGRDTQGRFSTGNSGGPGRPAYSNKSEYLTVTEGVVSPDRWRKIVERAANDAENGTGREAASAREFIAKYILPLPQKLDINVSGLAQAEYIGSCVTGLSFEAIEALQARFDKGEIEVYQADGQTYWKEKEAPHENKTDSESSETAK